MLFSVPETFLAEFYAILFMKTVNQYKMGATKNLVRSDLYPKSLLCWYFINHSTC